MQDAHFLQLRIIHLSEKSKEFYIMTFPIVHPSIHRFPSIQTYPLRSLQIHLQYAPDDPVKQYYSDLQVLESAAGFYIGTIFTYPSGHLSAGSRDSSYFPHLIQAQTALDYLEILSAHGPANLPMDIQTWESKFTHFFKIRVTYRMSP